MVGEHSNKRGQESAIGSRKAAYDSAVRTLLESLIVSAEKAGASEVHIYSGSDSLNCFFRVASKLEPSSKNFSNKILEELLDYVKQLANLNRSSLKQYSSANIDLTGRPINFSYFSNLEDKAEHLIISLEASSSLSLEELGLTKVELDRLKTLPGSNGIVVIDSKDAFTRREASNSLAMNLTPKGGSCLILDSSDFPSPSSPSNAQGVYIDRVFTKVEPESVKFVKSLVASGHDVVVFQDILNKVILDLAIEWSRAGRLVIVNSSRGSVAKAIKDVVTISAELPSKLVPELSTVISLKPIRSIRTSAGNHKLSPDVLENLEKFFGIGMPESWNTVYSHAGLNRPQVMQEVELPKASQYGSPVYLTEVLSIDEDFATSLLRNPQMNSEVIAWLAVKEGMLTQRHKGLIKALQKEVDLADVIDSFKN